MKGLMTYEDYQLLLKGDLGKYYEGRWEYFKKVLDIIKSEKIESVLEIGPAQEPIVKNCDVMIKPEKIIKIPRTGPEVSKGPRIIYFWKF